MIKVDGVWIAEPIVNFYKQYQIDFKEQLDASKNDQNVAMMGFMVGMLRKQIQVFRRVLIANNGMAATKAIISLRRWEVITFWFKKR